jgi:hypothetical protein
VTGLVLIGFAYVDEAVGLADGGLAVLDGGFADALLGFLHHIVSGFHGRISSLSLSRCSVVASCRVAPASR